MIIQCERCLAKYRLDDSKVGKKGVKVKCTKCGHLFIVKREEQAAPPPPIKEEKPPAVSFKEEIPPPTPETGLDLEKEWKVEWEKEKTAGKEEKPAEPPSRETFAEKEDFGFSFEEEKPSLEEKPSFKEFKEEEEVSFEEEKKEAAVPPPPSEKEWEVEWEKEETPEKEVTAQESPKETAPATPAHPPFEEEVFEGEVPEKEEAAPFGAAEKAEKQEAAEVTAEVFRKNAEKEEEALAATARRGGKLKWLVLVLISVLLYGGGAILYLSGALEPFTRGFAKQSESPLKVENLNGTFTDNEQSGRIFVIEGKIKNSSEEPQAIKKVRGTVYNKAGKAVATMEVSAGRLVSNEELRTLPKEDLLKQFKEVKEGSVPPKGTIPVMVVFTEVPEDIGEVSIEVIH